MSLKKEVFNFSFREKHLLEKTMTIVFLMGENEAGEDYYYYVGVNGKLLDKFYQAVRGGGPVDIGKFGVVLGEGRGQPAPNHREVATTGYLFNETATYAVLLPERKKETA